MASGVVGARSRLAAPPRRRYRSGRAARDRRSRGARRSRPQVGTDGRRHPRRKWPVSASPLPLSSRTNGRRQLPVVPRRWWPTLVVEAMTTSPTHGGHRASRHRDQYVATRRPPRAPLRTQVVGSWASRASRSSRCARAAACRSGVSTPAGARHRTRSVVTSTASPSGYVTSGAARARGSVLGRGRPRGIRVLLALAIRHPRSG